MSKRELISTIIGISGVLIWFCGTWYHGWNVRAESSSEVFTDVFGLSLIIIGYFVRPTKKVSEPINAQTVIINSAGNVELPTQPDDHE